jgi:hypothetical protein
VCARACVRARASESGLVRSFARACSRVCARGGFTCTQEPSSVTGSGSAARHLPFCVCVAELAALGESDAMPLRVLPCLMCDQCALQSLHHLENLMSLSVGFDEPVKLRNTFRRLRLMPPRHAQPSPLVMRAWLCCDV